MTVGVLPIFYMLVSYQRESAQKSAAKKADEARGGSIDYASSR
eukprot:SAG22_NODE_4917_length_1133_cov_1.596712_3_plen_43_part_00